MCVYVYVQMLHTCIHVHEYKNEILLAMPDHDIDLVQVSIIFTRLTTPLLVIVPHFIRSIVASRTMLFHKGHRQPGN